MREVLDAAGDAEPPPLVAELLGRPRPFRDGALPPAGAGPADSPSRAKDRSAVVQKNAGASLVDLGDGVLARRVPLEDERDRRRHDRRCCTPA